MIKPQKISIIGAGYVGLPLALSFVKKSFDVVAYDISNERVDSLKKGLDITDQVSKADLKNAINSGFVLSDNHGDLINSDFYIVTVPTPDVDGIPILDDVEAASKVIAGYLKKGDTVIFESSYMPGTTEDVCIPILEHFSALKLNSDFYVGYSPERVNPSDKIRTLANTAKVISASNELALEIIHDLYNKIINAKIHKAPNFKVAEACKILENTQRDINIALMNEMSIIFNNSGIDMNDVLDAASTKWNFDNYLPGLVGGHCVPVDPYCAISLGKKYKAETTLIETAREINSTLYSNVIMSIKTLTKNSLTNKVLFLGATYKSNCPDTRNSQPLLIVKKLLDSNFDVKVLDPYLPNKLSYVISGDELLIANINEFDLIIESVHHKLSNTLIKDIKKSYSKKIIKIDKLF